jgi:hypothetical protein
MGGTVAHPKLATVFNRSLLAASTAALIAGPLAAAGSAQSLDAVTGTTSNVVDLTCDEAKETKDLELIAEFCDADELPAPLAKATEDAEKKVEQESDKVTATVESTTGVKAPSSPTDGDGGSGDGGSGDGGSNPDSSPTGVLPTSGSSDSDRKSGGKNSRQVRGQGEQPRGISGGTRGEAAKTGGYGSSSYSGMRSNSALTLQPFAAPLVSVPPVYELPQVAQQLFGLDEAATTGDPMVAMAGDTTATSAYSSTGFTGTPADASGWLAATATGLIMLLGAAHALNGARTPKRKRA